MKLKSSRCIVIKLICCAAMVVIASAVALSQTPKSGALLTITSTPPDNSVNLKIYDSQIHTGTVRTVPLHNDTNGSSCVSGDQIPTDAYVLQGGAPTGCDPGDPFETSPSQQLGSAILGNFTITTKYPLVGNDQPAMCESPGNTGSVCIGAANVSVDTGFLTVTNNGAPFTGTITLSGNSPTADGSFCPASGSASDTFTGTLVNGGTVTLALSPDSSNCGGFNAPQTLTLTANQTSSAFFGGGPPAGGVCAAPCKDDYQIKPLNSAAGDTLDVLPVPVPAGPTGSEQSPAASSLYFSPGATFSSLKCIPYADFSALNNPVCVELQLTPHGDSGNYFYTATNDFNIDKNSLSGGIGGPSFLGHHLVNCPPDNGFDINILFSYTAPSVTFGDPLKGGGSGTGSCWVAAFDPNATAVTTGNTVSTFTGFTGLLSPPQLNLVNPGAAESLNFTYKTSSGSPVTNLHWCQTLFTTGSCSGVQTPWVSFGTLPISCTTENPPSNTPPVAVTGSSNLQNFGGGSYRFNWKTSKTATLGTCVTVVTEFDTGLTVFPDNFKYAKQ